jgi:hypothetical protein
MLLDMFRPDLGSVPWDLDLRPSLAGTGTADRVANSPFKNRRTTIDGNVE